MMPATKASTTMTITSLMGRIVPPLPSGPMEGHCHSLVDSGSLPYLLALRLSGRPPLVELALQLLTAEQVVQLLLDGAGASANYTTGPIEGILFIANQLIGREAAPPIGHLDGPAP